jgi:threonine aldolase
LDDLSHLSAVQGLARRLAEGLQALGLSVVAPLNISSLVFVRASDGLGAAELVQRCAAHGVLALQMDTQHVRFALYRGVTHADIDQALAAASTAIATG